MEFTEKTTKSGQIVIWTRSQELDVSLGLLFTPGERLQRYTSTIVTNTIEDRRKAFCTTKGMAMTTKVILPCLLQYAEEHYPKEFRPMPELALAQGE